MIDAGRDQMALLSFHDHPHAKGWLIGFLVWFGIGLLTLILAFYVMPK